MFPSTISKSFFLSNSFFNQNALSSNIHNPIKNNNQSTDSFRKVLTTEIPGVLISQKQDCFHTCSAWTTRLFSYMFLVKTRLFSDMFSSKTVLFPYDLICVPQETVLFHICFFIKHNTVFIRVSYVFCRKQYCFIRVVIHVFIHVSMKTVFFLYVFSGKQLCLYVFSENSTVFMCGLRVLRKQFCFHSCFIYVVIYVFMETVLFSYVFF